MTNVVLHRRKQPRTGRAVERLPPPMNLAAVRTRSLRTRAADNPHYLLKTKVPLSVNPDKKVA